MKIKLTNQQMEEIEGLTAEFPYVMHQIDIHKTLIPWHWHEELELNLVLEGMQEVQTVNQKYQFYAGEAYFINANVLVTMSAKAPAPMESHLFHPVFLGGHFRSIFETKYINPVIQNKGISIIEIRGENPTQSKILFLLKKAAALQKNIGQEKDTNMWELKLRNIFSEIWMLLLEEIQRLEFKRQNQVDMGEERIMLMLTYIHSHYNEKLTLEEIAESASVSTRECLRCFQRNLNETPFNYLLKYRIQISQKLLQQTNLSITEISQQCGFIESAYFSKIFRKMCGMSPREYRRVDK